jgi:hypothetical protein
MSTLFRLALRALRALALLALLASPLRAADSLFPDLAVEDFPDRPNTVRVAVRDLRFGALTAHAFHGRPDNIGFPSLVTATLSIDEETKRDRLEVVRVDDDCLAFGARLGLDRAEGCMTLTVTSVFDDVAKLVLRSRYFNYQLQLTLARSPGDPSLWSLVPTGRRGEPERFEARIREDGDEWQVEWLVYNRDRDSEVHLPLAATLDSGVMREAGLSPLHAAALVALDLFYDLGDFYVDQWVVYREDQIVDEGIPSPEENDPSRCEKVSVCGAEYETCVPTEDGWYGCNIPSEILGGWGGGYLDPLGPNNPPTNPPSRDPDWRVATPLTTPRGPSPLFMGMPLTTPPQGPGRTFDFQLTSLLTRADTVGMAIPASLWPGGHVTVVYLVKQGQIDPAPPACGEGASDAKGAGTPIPVGDVVRYPRPGAIRTICPSPNDKGLYQLRWELDYYKLWSEGVDGEANNTGVARGVWYYGGP